VKFRHDVLVLLFLCSSFVFAQTGVGLGLYPTGSETGFGLRLDKDARITMDARLAKANLFNDRSKVSSFASELSLVWRMVKLERVRCHIGLGYKTEWIVNDVSRHGVVIPLGVEAFPFPFQNAGLFFEAAPFYVSTPKGDYAAGIRTAGGFVFYFLKKNKTENDQKP
jgi:hypothetical protein